MALAETDFAEIEKILSAPEVDGGVIATLRGRFPHLSWSRCDASDVSEEPYRVFPHFDVHLLDAADHCVQLTTDPARATGIVMAARQVKP